MARTPDPEVARKRKRAAELERRGLSVRQIAEAMGGVKQPTVRLWLRAERGAIKHKPNVIELLHDGLPFEEIAAEAGCGVENVRKIEREIRHTLEADYTRAAKRLTRYLANPEQERNAHYTRYESFGRDLVRHCKHLVGTDPKSAKSVIALAVEQFSLLRGVFRSPENIQTATCQLVQVTSFDAARERALRRPETALIILRKIREAFPDCLSCDADLSRRESIVLRDLKRFRQSLKMLRRSRTIYASLEHSGHDNYGNGLANCAATEVILHYHTGSYSTAVQVADKALARLNPNAALKFNIHFNKALALFGVYETEAGEPALVEEAALIAESLLKNCGDQTSMPRVYATYLAARAAELKHQLAVAQSFYEDAYQSAQELEIPELTATILSDMENLQPNPTSLRGRIDRLRIHQDGNFPPWLQPVARTLHETHSLSRIDVGRALQVLRAKSGGEKLLPRKAA